MSVQNPPCTILHKIPDEVEQELDRMEHIGVHCKVKKPTSWINSMHVVYKQGKIKVCLNPRDLNQYIMREHYPMPNVQEVAGHICRDPRYLVALMLAVGIGKYH